jgi:hypothetical protein
MGNREPKRLTPTAAAGVKGIIAARARTRRETQGSLSEISSHAPPARRNDLAPELRLEHRSPDSLRPASRQVRRARRNRVRSFRPASKGLAYAGQS